MDNSLMFGVTGLVLFSNLLIHAFDLHVWQKIPHRRRWHYSFLVRESWANWNCSFHLPRWCFSSSHNHAPVSAKSIPVVQTQQPGSAITRHHRIIYLYTESNIDEMWTYSMEIKWSAIRKIGVRVNSGQWLPWVQFAEFGVQFANVSRQSRWNR